MRKDQLLSGVVGVIILLCIVLYCLSCIVDGIAQGAPEHTDAAVSSEVIPPDVSDDPQEDQAQQVERETPEPLPQPEEQVQHLYTEADAIALAKMAWGECRGVGKLIINGKAVSGACQKAAAIWCALNRYDAGFEDSIAEVVAAPMQFVGYAAGNPVDPELLALAYDVLERWERERLHGGDVGRVLPADYMWFTGDGLHNWFVNEWKSDDYYTWELPDPYAEQLACN